MKKTDLFLILVLGPAGVGKNTMIDMFIEKHDNFKFLITAQTREKRPHEIHGVHRYFYTKEEFLKELEEGDFYENAIVHGLPTGVPKKSIDGPMSEGLSVIGEVDYQGAKTLKSREDDMMGKVLTIFMEFEDEEHFEQRIRDRENDERFAARLKSMREEMKHKDSFDYLITSYEGDIEKTYEEFERCLLEGMDKIKRGEPLK